MTQGEPPRPIVFRSDYGLRDEFVGVCHAVIAGIAPLARVVDLTHAVRAHDPSFGAVILADAWPYLPSQAVVLAVVDPGVGTSRRAVAVGTADGRHLVGPDNGLLSLAWRAGGGATEATEVTSPDVVLSPMSRTFHGRDVFAPAAAHLAEGMPLAALGPPIDPSTLVRIEAPRASVAAGRVEGDVLDVDRFGNVRLTAGRADLEAAGLLGSPTVEVAVGDGSVEAPLVWTFAEAGDGPAVMIDSVNRVAVVCRGASASDRLGVVAGDRVVLRTPSAMATEIGTLDGRRTEGDHPGRP
jgi:S-adenosyl-L-methionine hydrolase (adenosine-forming)